MNFEQLLNAIKRENPNCEIKLFGKKKATIFNFPFNRINVDIKFESYGIFVFRFFHFEFFAYDLLERYLETKLKHEDAKFILNSKSVYVYPHKYEIEACLKILNYTKSEISSVINKILSVINQ